MFANVPSLGKLNSKLEVNTCRTNMHRPSGRGGRWEPTPDDYHQFADSTSEHLTTLIRDEIPHPSVKVIIIPLIASQLLEIPGIYLLDRQP